MLQKISVIITYPWLATPRCVLIKYCLATIFNLDSYFLCNISVLLDVQVNLPETSPFFVYPNGFGEHFFQMFIVFGTYNFESYLNPFVRFDRILFSESSTECQERKKEYITECNLKNSWTPLWMWSTMRRCQLGGRINIYHPRNFAKLEKESFA